MNYILLLLTSNTFKVDECWETLSLPEVTITLADACRLTCYLASKAASEKVRCLPVVNFDRITECLYIEWISCCGPINRVTYENKSLFNKKAAAIRVCLGDWNYFLKQRVKVRELTWVKKVRFDYRKVAARWRKNESNVKCYETARLTTCCERETKK